MTRIAVGLTLVLVAGCGRSPEENRPISTNTDSWFAPGPPLADMVRVKSDRYAPVRDELQAKAQGLLEKTGAQQITAEEAAEYAGKPLPAGGVFVLLRAVVLNEENGGYDLAVKGDAAAVHFGCLGRTAVPMKRKALVAVLPVVPKVVYVSCSMAE
jgi:hypothetical protein